MNNKNEKAIIKKRKVFLVVDKDYRNQGYGSLMVKSVITNMIESGIYFMNVKISSMNESVCSLFRDKLNFVELVSYSNPFNKNELIEFLYLPFWCVQNEGIEKSITDSVIFDEKLRQACKNLDIKKIKEAIAEGANVNKLFIFEDTQDDDFGVVHDEQFPLYFAIAKNNIELVEILINAGADVTETYHQQTPLMTAMEQPDFDMISLLIQAGCDINAVDYIGYSLLHLAFGFEDIAIAKALIDASADMYVTSSSGVSIIDEAMMHDDPKFIFLLIRSGYDVNHQDENGSTLLHKAVKSICDDAIFHALLFAGANIHQVNADGYTALDLVKAMLNEYQLKSFDSYRLRAEINQLNNIKDILLKNGLL